MNRERNAVIGLIVGVVVLTAVFLVGFPLYRVWSQEQRGRADLAEARFNRQVIIEEAQARLEASRLEAQSNEALIASLGGDPELLIDFRLIDAMQQAELVYVPTEAGLPILEAGRLQEQQ